MKRLYLFITVSCLILAAGCKNNNDNGGGGGNQPTIVSITPSQVSRGQLAIEGRIQGTNLGGILSVTLGEGITVDQVSGLSATEISIRFSVSANAAAGTRTITVTTSAGTATIATLLTVSNNRAPIPKITVTPTSGGKNTNFIFDATDSSDPGGVIATFRWEFGDGSTANGRITTHKYGAAGRYVVTLTVTDRDNSSNQTTRTIEVENGLAPIPHFSISPESGDIDTLFRFDATPSKDNDGSITKIEWKFDDGATAVGVIVTHRFRTSGTFEVVLTVTDNDGLKGSLGKDLRVEKFNQTAAIREIQNVIVRFFKRFSKLDKLTAEQIVEDWSQAPECPGRDREIRIIEHQQTTIQKTDADIVGDIPVFIHPTRVIANATAEARFQWTEKDGSKHTGNATHGFTFQFENGHWLVCDFTVAESDAAVRKLFEE